jgi:hypothetical protein
MFINIPVGLVYAWLMVYLLSFARITFLNTSNEDIGPIQIEGCEHREIEKIKKDESKTIWIKIPGDCRIEIRYSIKNLNRHDTIAKSVTPDSGLKLNYELRSGQ